MNIKKIIPNTLILICIVIIIFLLCKIVIQVFAYQTGTHTDEAVAGDFYVAGNAEIAGTLQAGTFDISEASISVTSATISSGSVSYLSFYMSILGEGGSNDNLDTISGGEVGDVINIFPSNTNSNITLTENGNIELGDLSNCALKSKGTLATLYKVDSTWELIACLN